MLIHGCTMNSIFNWEKFATLLFPQYSLCFCMEHLQATVDMSIEPPVCSRQELGRSSANSGGHGPPYKPLAV